MASFAMSEELKMLATKIHQEIDEEFDFMDGTLKKSQCILLRSSVHRLVPFMLCEYHRMSKPLNKIAWTFGLTAKKYVPEKET